MSAADPSATEGEAATIEFVLDSRTRRAAAGQGRTLAHALAELVASTRETSPIDLVLLDGAPVRAGQVPLGVAAGRDVTTVVDPIAALGAGLVGSDPVPFGAVVGAVAAVSRPDRVRSASGALAEALAADGVVVTGRPRFSMWLESSPDVPRFEVVAAADPAPDPVQPALPVWAALDPTGRLVVHSSTADPGATRLRLARVLGRPAASIRVIARVVGSLPADDGAVPDVLPGDPGSAEHRVATRTVRTGIRTVAAPLTSLGSAAPRPDRAGARHALAPDAPANDDSDETARPSGPGNSGPAPGDPTPAFGIVLDKTSEHAVVAARRLLDEWSAAGDDVADASVPVAARLLGRGVAPAVGATGPASASCAASIEACGDHSFLLTVSGGEPGSRRLPALARVAAEVLGATPADVVVRAGDTDLDAPGSDPLAGGFGLGVGAVLDAADDLRRRLAVEAASKLHVRAATIEIHRGRAHAPGGRSIDLAELVGAPVGAADFVGHGTASGPRPAATGAHAVSVQVDAETGDVRVVAVVSVVDAGVAVDPHAVGWRVADQVHAAIASALGTGVRTSVPHHLVVVRESLDDADPFGVRTLGGIGRSGVAAAIAAAVEDASGALLPPPPWSAHAVLDRLDARADGRHAAAEHVR